MVGITGCDQVKICDRIAAFPECIDEVRPDEAAAGGKKNFHFRGL